MEKREYNQIHKEIMMEFKIIDPTIKNIKETDMYKDAQSFNDGLRKCLEILKKYNN